jgi:hypothetical protein
MARKPTGIEAFALFQCKIQEDSSEEAGSAATEM